MKGQPYRMNPLRLATFQKKKYMIENDITGPSQSSWSSPIVLVPKPDGSMRFCIDYRKVNSVTKLDS